MWIVYWPSHPGRSDVIAGFNDGDLLQSSGPGGNGPEAEASDWGYDQLTFHLICPIHCYCDNFWYFGIYFYLLWIFSSFVSFKTPHSSVPRPSIWYIFRFFFALPSLVRIVLLFQQNPQCVFLGVVFMFLCLQTVYLKHTWQVSRSNVHLRCHQQLLTPLTSLHLFYMPSVIILSLRDSCCTSHICWTFWTPWIFLTFIDL